MGLELEGRGFEAEAMRASGSGAMCRGGPKGAGGLFGGHSIGAEEGVQQTVAGGPLIGLMRNHPQYPAGMRLLVLLLHIVISAKTCKSDWNSNFKE